MWLLTSHLRIQNFMDCYRFNYLLFPNYNLSEGQFVEKKTIHTVCEIVEAVEHVGVEELNAKQLN